MTAPAPDPGGGDAAAFDMDCYRQQLEEAVALQAIYEDDFRLVACNDHGDPTDGNGPSSSCAACNGGDLEPEGLLAAADAMASVSRPAAGLSFELLVHVELPPGGLQLQLQLPVDEGPTPASGSAGSSGAAGVGGSMAPANGGCASTAAEPHQQPEAKFAKLGEPVAYLTPLCLVLRLPPDYPARRPPVPELRALWLSDAQAQRLVQELMLLWDEQGPGSPLCYLWAELLKEQTLRLLGVGGVLTIPTISTAALQQQMQQQQQQRQQQPVAGGTVSISGSDGQSNSGLGSNASAGAEPAFAVRAAEETAVNLLRYAAMRSQAAFQQETHRCPICWDDVLGARCVRLPECGHAFCADCFSTHCRTLTAEGSVERITCPDPSCRLPVPQQVLRGVLSEDEYARWESLVLQKALDRMSDVVYCPRCQAICLEDKDHMGECPTCLYVFCSNCLMGWHPAEPCVDPVAALQRRAAVAANAKLTEAEKRRREADLINQMKSMVLVKATSRPCPSCNMAIDKYDGCNKVHCSNCGELFCWRCLQVIHGYDHFSAQTCTIFDDAVVQQWNAMNAGLLRDEQFRQAGMGGNWRPMRGGGGARTCPWCGQANFKVAGNNNIKCWACNNNFCALCREPLRGKPGLHFGPSGCKQHSFEH